MLSISSPVNIGSVAANRFGRDPRLPGTQYATREAAREIYQRPPEAPPAQNKPSAATGKAKPQLPQAANLGALVKGGAVILIGYAIAKWVSLGKPKKAA